MYSRTARVNRKWDTKEVRKREGPKRKKSVHAQRRRLKNLGRETRKLSPGGGGGGGGRNANSLNLRTRNCRVVVFFFNSQPRNPNCLFRLLEPRREED